MNLWARLIIVTLPSGIASDCKIYILCWAGFDIHCTEAIALAHSVIVAKIWRQPLSRIRLYEHAFYGSLLLIKLTTLHAPHFNNNKLWAHTRVRSKGEHDTRGEHEWGNSRRLTSISFSSEDLSNLKRALCKQRCGKNKGDTMKMFIEHLNILRLFYECGVTLHLCSRCQFVVSKRCSHVEDSEYFWRWTVT